MKVFNDTLGSHVVIEKYEKRFVMHIITAALLTHGSLESILTDARIFQGAS